MDSSKARSLTRNTAALRHGNLRLGRFLSESSSNQIVASRMLVFEAKLLLMNMANRRFRRTQARRDLKQVEHLRAELHRAEAALRKIELEGRLSSSPDYWLAVYTSLIDRATASLDYMTAATRARPAAERFETATDVQMLEELIAHWTSRMREIEQGTTGGAAPGGENLPRRSS